MKYTDDGKGFDAGKTLLSETESLGLKSLQSRVGFMNGEISIQSEPGEGVEITIQVPV